MYNTVNGYYIYLRHNSVLSLYVVSQILLNTTSDILHFLYKNLIQNFANVFSLTIIRLLVNLYKFLFKIFSCNDKAFTGNKG